MSSNVSNNKGVYFVPIFISSFVLLIFYSINANYPAINFIIWIFGWFVVSNNFLVYINTLSALFFGYLSWSIVIYYFGTTNKQRFKRGIKSIFISFPFWLGVSIFMSSVGVSTYNNVWLLAHILFRVWNVGGFILAFIMMLNFVSSRFFKPIFKHYISRGILERDKELSIPRSRLIKMIDILEKYETLIFIFIILILGSFFSVSNFLRSEIIPFFFIFFTLFIVNFLFIFNYLLSVDQDYHRNIKQKEKDFFLNDFERLIKKANSLIEEGNVSFSNKLYKNAIKEWNEVIDIYKVLLRVAKDKRTFRENIHILKLNLLDAYKGAALNYLKNGLDKYKNLDLETTHAEWKSSIKDLRFILKITKFRKLKLERKEIKLKIKEIKRNLKRLEIEIMINDADEELKSAHLLQDKEIAKTITITNDIVVMYLNAKKKAEKSKEFKDYIEKIQNRLLNVRVFQEKLHEELDKLMGITPLEKRVKFDMEELTEFEIATAIQDEIIKQIISVVREYDFIGGQIRFKIGLINNSNYSLTNLRITFDLPKSLKWILHEPNYERKGDSILIPKIGAKEKKAVSLYFEPLNCMESHLNATVSFFDVKDKPHAISMKPKMIAISCPIFFTESDANLARVKSLRRTLTHRDKKIFPIINPKEASSIFSSILSVLGQFDIKLIAKEFFEENNFGEAWFFGITKVKKERLVMYVLLDGERKTLEFEVSGNNEEQITAFLAEIGDRVRQKLIENNIISTEEGFYDMRIAILSCLCPYCFTLMSSESVEKFCNGEIIICKNCDVSIKID